jgi:5-methylcytosine-specific restriction endonuclease McrA
MSKNIRKRRDKLWIEKNGKCYWCGIDTIITTKILPALNTATLDHLRTRLDDNRLEPNNNNEERTVLSCWKCNNARGICDQKATQDIVIKVPKSSFRLR